MPRRKKTTGRPVDCDGPDWQPLRLTLVHAVLLDWFQYLDRIELADGTPLHEYRHSITRQPLFLTPECSAYSYGGRVKEPEGWDDPFERDSWYHPIYLSDAVAIAHESRAHLDPPQTPKERIALARVIAAIQENEPF
jgi:hypothetical protein